MSINKIASWELMQNIAQGSLTNSKHPSRFVAPFYPMLIERGSGCCLFDQNGYRYLDFICGLGTNLFGYGNPLIETVCAPHRMSGLSHSLPTKWEVIAAKIVKEGFPWIEKVKFVNDGSSACTAAVLAARAYVDSIKEGHRTVVLSEGYHGWHPEFTSLTPPANGVTSHPFIEKAKYRDDGSIYIGKDVAAVIIEPVQLDDSRERIDWLNRLRKECIEKKVVLIFDETITGFRYPNLSVSNHFSIEPDILILGKAIANGEKLAIVAGKSKIMDLEYFCSGTYHGHIGSLIAFCKCFDLIRHNNNFDIKSLKERGLAFQERFNNIFDGLFRLIGYGTRGAFVGDEMNRALFMQEMAKAKILFGPSFFLCFDHLKDDHIESTLYLCERIAERIRNGSVVLSGTLPTSPFSSKSRS